jgi:hypothetical protein
LLRDRRAGESKDGCERDDSFHDMSSLSKVYRFNARAAVLKCSGAR